MDTEGVVIAEFEKNAREVVKVRLTRYAGRDLVDIRAWYEGDDGAFHPGKGIALRRDLLPELRKALAAAEEAAELETAAA
jgi:hypothetical protein